MSWEFFLAGNILTFSITTLLQKVLLNGKNSKPIAYTLFFQLFTGIFVVIIGILLHAFVFPQLTLNLLFFLIIGIFLYAFGNLYIFKALKETEASKFTVIYSTRVLFTVLVAVLFLSESFVLKEIIGTIFIFSGIVIVSLKSNKIHLQKGDFYALIAAVFFGLANANAKFLLHSLAVYPYMAYVFFAPPILLGIIYPKELQYISHFLEKKNFIKMFWVSLFWALANICFFEAVKRTPSISILSAIQLTSVVVTVILSIIFLKERKNIGKKLLGTVISFIGLLLLTI
ncbi:MAG TPA: EamA family transporter [Patescibacteria group bacterium]